MSRFFILAFSLCLFTLPVAAQEDKSSALLENLIEDMHAADMAADPVAAGLEGDKAARRRLPDVSPEAKRKISQQDEAFRARWESISLSDLPDDEKLNYALVGWTLSQKALLAPIDGSRIPFNNDSGFYNGLTYSVRNTRFDTEADYRDYIARLRDVPRYFDQHISNMRRGMAGGYTAPAAIMPGVVKGVHNITHITAENHPLAAPFMTVNSRLPESQRSKIKSDGLAVIRRSVLPSYKKLLAFMETEYVPAARPKIGLSSTPGGRANYARLVKYYTTLDMKPEQVHKIGQAEVKRIRSEMNAIISETGFDGTFAEFLVFLRTDPQFYATSREDLLKEASYIAKRIDGKMPEFFGTLPRLSYGVIAVPAELEQNYTTGRYFGGNAKQGKAGNYVVNTYDLPQRPLYNLPALTLHEGVPGHHHQISLAAEQEDVPEFRQNLYPHAFGEGWGLYAEKLGVEMGIYRTPYEQFGRLTYEMWRACRLVMDTGMHYMDWTRDKAESCLRENSALAEHNIKTETDRYIAWPGQALAYKMGELKILELRKRAETALGADFDIRRFHDAVLVDGAVPLNILETRIDDWIVFESDRLTNDDAEDEDG
ncbi:DUF885 domain-containing protein [Robiginitomaculum antarcticum]|uniref:DUF885 domain-containing protein n=1 Tax=Robiginitomaculum antarcticum TaxID=437507 RepID=UPI00035D4A2E|nr:DUF885 family protein [Robiginitomaculum antarcticum]